MECTGDPSHYTLLQGWIMLNKYMPTSSKNGGMGKRVYLKLSDGSKHFSSIGQLRYLKV
jgi:hypothetical protein